MKNYFFVVIMVILLGCKEDCLNDTLIDPSQITTLPVFINPEVLPVESGTEAMYKFIYSKIKYPPAARENGIKGQVTWTFTISSDGSTNKYELKSGIGYGCDEECLRVLQLMHWLPAKKDNTPVSMRYTLPIKFVL